jgi:hypothetical protein
MGPAAFSSPYLAESYGLRQTSRAPATTNLGQENPVAGLEHLDYSAGSVSIAGIGFDRRLRCLADYPIDPTVPIPRSSYS